VSDPDRTRFVQHVLALYKATPGTRGRIRPADRRLAEALYQDGTSTEIIRAALILAAARRSFRSPEVEPLQPVASLHYFLPVINEIRANPLDPDYVDYLQARIADLDNPSLIPTPTGHRSA